MRMWRDEEIYIKMNYSMVKYKVDLSDTAYFNGITIDSSYLSEGLEYAKNMELTES